MSEESTQTQDAETVAAPISDSLGAWLKERRAQLAAKRSYEVPVHGFDGRVIGVYRALSYEEFRRIGSRHEKLPEATQELYVAADTLIASCERIYARGDDGTTADLPMWGVELARTFGIDNPDVNTPRRAVLAIFDGAEMNLILHFGSLMAQRQAIEEAVDGELGEA
jgi:hypothetical protein